MNGKKRIGPMRIGPMTIAMAVFAVFLATPARASAWNELTYFTFSAPVELPGIALAPGTYMFQLADLNDRQVVEVFSRDGSRIYGTFLTNPVIRTARNDVSRVTFAETPEGTPDAVKAWFYTGEPIGHKFIYSDKQRAADTSR